MPLCCKLSQHGKILWTTGHRNLIFAANMLARLWQRLRHAAAVVPDATAVDRHSHVVAVAMSKFMEPVVVIDLDVTLLT